MIMENSQGQGNQSTAGTATTSASTATSSTASTQASQNSTPTVSENVEAAVSQNPMQNAYTPNYKYKYLAPDGSNKVEQEMEEMFRPLIKDSDTEKKIRELHEKAYGLDFVKQDRESLKQKTREYEERAKTHEDQMNVFRYIAKNKDFGLASEVLGFRDEDIINHAVKLLELKSLPKEKQEEYAQQREMNQKVFTYEHENQTLKQQLAAMAVSRLESEISSTLSRPNYSQIASEYDSRAGEGAFRKRVVERGQFHAANGTTISVEQAVNEVLEIMQHPSLYQQQTSQAAVPQPVVQQNTPPVIPYIAGKGSSPAKRVPKTLDDLRKRAAEIGAQ